MCALVNRSDTIKVFLMGGVALLLLIGIFDVSYGFYQLIRFVAMAVFGYFAYDAHKEGKEDQMFVMIALAVLFQPFFKVNLGRVIWKIVDLLVLLYLSFLIYKSVRKS